MSKQKMFAKILSSIYLYDNDFVLEGYVRMSHPNTKERLYIGPKGGIKRGQCLAYSKYDRYLPDQLLRRI